MILPTFDSLVVLALNEGEPFDAIEVKSDLVCFSDQERCRELYMWLRHAKISVRAEIDVNEVTKFYDGRPTFVVEVLEGQMLIRVDHRQTQKTADLAVACKHMAQLQAAAVIANSAPTEAIAR